jgi:hypothetical protein
LRIKEHLECLEISKKSRKVRKDIKYTEKFTLVPLNTQYNLSVGLPQFEFELEFRTQIGILEIGEKGGTNNHKINI